MTSKNYSNLLSPKFFNSWYIVLFIGVFILLSNILLRTFYFENWGQLLSWDITAYYIYLPSIFIYNDPGMVNQEWVIKMFETYQFSPTRYQIHLLANGNWSSMYSMGFAILYLPFFLLGHVWALLSDFPADGFSLPYQICVGNGMFIYVVTGIFFLRKVLLQFFEDKITLIILLLLFFGTNYFQLTVINHMAPHATMFTFLSIILYLTIKWHKQPTKKLSFIFGLILGLSLLLRANIVIFFTIPLLWNIYNIDSFKNKITLIVDNKKMILFGLFGFFIFPAIQIIYWKLITGDYIYNPYSVTPGFDWLGPQFTKLLFSYFKGWFIYTPIMIFAIIGLIHLWKQNKHIAGAIIIAVILNIYTLACWGTWWGGGEFGARYFVESYAVLSIPFGAFIISINKKHILRYVFILLISFFVFLNLFQTWQFNTWIIEGYRMTKEYYWKSFLKTKVTEEDTKYMSVNRTFTENEAFADDYNYTKKTIGYLDFDAINTIPFNTSFIDTVFSYSKPNSYKLTFNEIYGPTFKILFSHITPRDHAWLRISCKFYPTKDLKEFPLIMVCSMDHNKGQYIEQYRGWPMGDQTYKLNEWNTFSFDYLTPYPLNENKDEFIIYPYLQGDNVVYFDDFHVEAFERKW